MKIKFSSAVKYAIYEEMEDDSSIIMLGPGVYEDIFAEKFSSNRVIDTPLSEASVCSIGLGMVKTGMKVIVDLKNTSFMLVAFDQIFNHAAKAIFMSGNQKGAPIIFRAKCGAIPYGGPQHSMISYNLFMCIPGVKVVMPSNAYDAKGIMKSCINGDDPVIFLEHINYRSKSMEAPQEDFRLPIGKARVVTEGNDLTIICIGGMLYDVLEITEAYKIKGWSIEVIDPVTINPIDMATIIESTRMTGKLLIIDECNGYCSLGSQIAQEVYDVLYGNLKKPIKVITSKKMHIPYNLESLKKIVPQKEYIEMEIDKLLI